jgi:putative ABC transport system permease protein
MVSIARSMLLFDWRRYLAAVLAVTFSGLLVIVQLALLLGMFSTVSVVIDRSTADLWIGYRNTQSVDLGRPIAREADARAWAHRGVDRVERYASAYGDLRREDGVPVTVVINGIDASPEAVAFSKLLSADQRALLREPNAILIDIADTGKLGARVGTVVEINGKRARVVGVVEGMRAIGGVNVVASVATARTLAPETASLPTFSLVRLKPGYAADVVAKEIADDARVPSYSVWTANDFSIRSQTYWLLESGAGIGSGFASLLALLVGLVITSQTLSGAILASIKEFAALRALGVSRGSLRAVVIEQAAWVGLAGLTVTALLTAAVAWLGHVGRIAMSFPWWMLFTSAAALMGIAMVSGLLALRPLLQTEPASLLR